MSSLRCPVPFTLSLSPLRCPAPPFPALICFPRASLFYLGFESAQEWLAFRAVLGGVEQPDGAFEAFNDHEEGVEVDRRDHVLKARACCFRTSFAC
jgi:hypothetical protein